MLGAQSQRYVSQMQSAVCVDTLAKSLFESTTYPTVGTCVFFARPIGRPRSTVLAMRRCSSSLSGRLGVCGGSVLPLVPHKQTCEVPDSLQHDFRCAQQQFCFN